MEGERHERGGKSNEKRRKNERRRTNMMRIKNGVVWKDQEKTSKAKTDSI